MEMDTSSNHPWLSFSLSQQPNLFDQAFSSSTTHHSGVEEEDKETTNICGTHLSYATELNNVIPDFSPEQPVPAEPKKAIESFGQRTSIYRGVTRHRWTGRYEAHLWDNSCRREGQNRKGRQVYLGGYDKEEKAARAYDLAALKYWGTTTTTNFPITDYEKEIEEMMHMTRQEFVASLRRKSSGFSRGASMYRGVTRHHQHGRWQARIGRVAGNKDLYLGTFGTEEEAAEAYDIAAIKFRGLNAVTNFEISRYDVESIINGNLPIGGSSISAARSTKQLSDGQTPSCSSDMINVQSKTLMDGQDASTSSLNFTPLPMKPNMDYNWSLLALQNQHNLQQERINHGLGLGLGFSNFFSGTNLDFSNASSSYYGTNNDGMPVQQNHAENNVYSNSSDIPHVTHQDGFGSGPAGSSNGYEVSPLMYYYHQAALQTIPIFGME